MIRKVGWVPQKGILYVIPVPEHAERCQSSFLDYDFSKVVSKVSVHQKCLILIPQLHEKTKKTWMWNVTKLMLWNETIERVFTCYNSKTKMKQNDSKVPNQTKHEIQWKYQVYFKF